ncbi:MAG: hypothetical protein JWN66_692 [Sphingomonas bacterium]|uniref:hypothetical protein n=1 Tax=Sphingomonas bacterium TaxID=1895847 RepID=UPI00261487BB|nr:hypothetical protein [Sphingomonas bacterium]MDB5703576.1 hypothetical protein [Sphingomonas bacterium]
MAIIRSGTLLAAVFMLAACHGSDTSPGADTPAQQQQLNDAAAMLDANSVDMNAVAPNSTNEDQPQ